MDTCSNSHSFDRLKGTICSCYIHLKTPNIILFFSTVCKHCKCKQTFYRLMTWLKQLICYRGGSVLSSIALSINRRVVTFLQAHPSPLYQNRGGGTVLILFRFVCVFALLTAAYFQDIKVSPTKRYKQ
jgi:hypothetical protein